MELEKCCKFFGNILELSIGFVYALKCFDF